MGNNQFLEGNVRERSFKDIWEDSNSFEYNRRFKLNELGENCIDCYYGSVCKGGCNSVSFHLSKSLHDTPICLRRIEEDKFDVKPSIKEQIAMKLSLIDGKIRR
jgi:radical SAM protein with 4Fe4S-binding SPASM domain